MTAAHDLTVDGLNEAFDPSRDLRSEVRARLERGQSLKDLDLSRADLSGVDLSGADLSGVVLFEANLQGATLVGAVLDDADLKSADLSLAQLAGARIRNAHCGGACFRGASLVQADLSGADLRGCDLHSSRLRHATLSKAELSHCDLQEADLKEAIADRCSFVSSDLRKASLHQLKGYVSATFLHVDVRDTDFRGSLLLRRQILDENYLDEFKNQSRMHNVVYHLWSLTSDCGRSALRWATFMGLITLFFALVYQFVNVDFGPHETWLSSIYFSIVTLTTLGYGDVLPTSAGAQAIVMAQVVVGYIGLGGLLTVISNKMGRRAE